MIIAQALKTKEGTVPSQDSSTPNTGETETNTTASTHENQEGESPDGMPITTGLMPNDGMLKRIMIL